MIEQNYLDSIRYLFRYYRGLGEKAMMQLSAEDLQRAGNPESNSIAVIVHHLSGNMLSRWTDFLNSDGEKPWRNREQEFEDTLDSAEKVQQAWVRGWDCLFAALDALTAEDLSRIIYIRNEGQTVVEAINRQLGHYSYHIGQIVYLARQWRGPAFQSLSIPRGGSEAFNAEKFAKEKGRRGFSEIFRTPEGK